MYAELRLSRWVALLTRGLEPITQADDAPIWFELTFFRSVKDASERCRGRFSDRFDYIR
jgi:hypothetical protein